MRSDREKFTIYLDVKHFAPDDLNVKVTDDYVEIKGKHGERQVFVLPFVCILLLFVLKTDTVLRNDQISDPKFNSQTNNIDIQNVVELN